MGPWKAQMEKVRTIGSSSSLGHLLAGYLAFIASCSNPRNKAWLTIVALALSLGVVATWRYAGEHGLMAAVGLSVLVLELVRYWLCATCQRPCIKGNGSGTSTQSLPILPLVYPPEIPPDL